MSLRWKLVLLYALILAVVIGGLAVLLVWSMRRSLISASDAELASRARMLGSELDFEEGRWTIDPESGLDREYQSDRGLYYYVRDLNEQWRIVLSSPLARSSWPQGGPSFDEVFEVEKHPFEVREYLPSRPRDWWIQGRHYREVGVSITPDEGPVAETRTDDLGTVQGGHHTLVVCCGMDLGRVDDVVEKFTGGSILIGSLLLLASLAGGWFLVSRALRPIDQMAHTARRINETDLSRRIPVTSRDELGRLADTLNATFERIQKGFERERQFTADASHELRTPLAVIAGNAEVALNKDRTPAEYRQMLSDIGGAAARMQTIVEGLLTLARVDRHTPPRDRHPVALAPLCEDVVRLHRSFAVRAGVSLYLATDPKIELKADADGLKTVVSNLVSNAIRYNHDGGRVGIEVARENGVVRIRVEDTGIGIPKEHLPHLFERFYRVDPARSAASGGVGLGLAIANAIVAAHHGTIAIESEPGRGTKVEVRLPG